MVIIVCKQVLCVCVKISCMKIRIPFLYLITIGHIMLTRSAVVQPSIQWDTAVGTSNIFNFGISLPTADGGIL